MMVNADEILNLYNHSQNAPKSQNDMENLINLMWAHFGKCVADGGYFFGDGLSP